MFLFVFFLGLFFQLFAVPTLFANATVHGLTGTMLVPGLEVMEKGGARAAIHFNGQSDFDEASFKGVFAFSDDSEVALVKRFGLNGRKDYSDPVFAAKYQIRPNMAVAGIIDPNDDYKDSIMLISGLPGNRVVLGGGLNIAFNDRQRKAFFGSYDESGYEADTFFFVMGANLNIDTDTKLLVDYTGNDFCIGFRHEFDQALTLDLGIFTPNKINKQVRYMFGANFGF